ncbi:PQQ-binding-like beta-propeller repeat protein [Candidatus Woesearchaeota archaeon]|nr:PQQ-binding-like beta-propeller repeat protein [Candidatus Woesearchaeota archaeon]
MFDLKRKKEEQNELEDLVSKDYHRIEEDKVKEKAIKKYKPEFVVALLLIVASMLIFRAAYTGLFIYGEAGYSKELNLTFNETATYNLFLNASPLSLKLSGSVVGNGYAKVYLLDNGIRKLIVDSSQLQTSYDLITAYAIAEEFLNETNIPENITNTTEAINQTTNAAENIAEIANQTNLTETSPTLPENITEPANQTENIAINRAPVWIFDADSFIVAGNLTINLSQYFIDLDNDSISYIVSEPENVLILKEFEMITLAPDANIVGNRTIKIFASDLKNTTEKEVTLVINTTKEAAETAPENITIPVKVFDSICVDTCFLTGVGRNITLLIEIENATLNLTKLEYDAKPENITANNPPQCSLIPNVNISKNELSTIWLDKYCSDANDDTLSYDVSLSSKEVDTMITKDMVTFIPRKNFVGTTFMSFVVNDSKNITFTNIIVINVTGNITEKKRNATINLKNNKKEKTGSYSLTNNSDETFDLELSNLPGFGVLEKKKESRINIKKIKELKDADVLIDAIEDNRIGTDVFAINETLDFESAAITLAKNSDVNSVFYCSDFDFETLSCSNWQKTDIPFTDNGNTITFNVTHFSAYAGGLTIINVYSHPSLYGNWIVGFNTTGAANLTITATRESNYTNIYTRWSNESEDSGLYDLRFLEVKCGNQTMNYEWQGTNCFEQECSVFIANYSCNETAQEISKVLTAKRHVLKFEFGGQIAYAYNAVGNESSDSGTDEWRMFGRYLNQTRYTNSAAPTNLANAKIITFSSTSTIQSSPAVANGYVYVGSDDAKLYQLNASNISQQVASFSAAGAIYSSPAVADGYVYILNYNTTIYQLNASNVSQKIASFSTGGGFYNTQSSPVVSNGFVYVGSSLGVLYQLNASNVSQKIANFTAGDGMYTVPAVANGFVYAGSNDAKLYQLNASNVSQQIANFSAGVFYSSAAVANGFVYVGNDDGNLYQLNASNVSQKIANYSTGGAIRSSPAVANGYVYVGSNDNRTYQLNATNVSLLIASYTANNNIQSSPAVTDSYVFIGSYDDKLYQLNATNISILVSSYTTSGDVISSPAVANGSVYVGSLDWKLYQFILDVTYPSINFTQPPTPPNGTTTKNTSVQINISITNASDLAEFKWNWNGTNYTFYNASLVLMMNFDNVSSIGESATNAVDVSKYGNNGTLTNGAVWNCSSGKYGCALQFDGINDLVSIPDSSSWDFGNRDFTVNLWVNFKNLSYASFIDQFWSVRAWVIGYNATALYFRYSTDGTTVNGDHTVPWSANNNTWYYITALRSGSNIRLYVDGSQIGSDFNAGTDVIYNSNKALWVGCAHTGGGGDTPGFCLNGSIDEIRIWNRSLSAAEINQSYMSNLYKYDTDKWAFYTNQTNLTNGSYTYFGYVKDITGNSNQTEVRTLTIGNTAPTATNIILNSTDSLNRTNGTLQGFWTFSDADGDTQQNNETMWYNNSVEIVSLRNNKERKLDFLCKGL